MVSIQYLYMLRIELINAWTDARSVQLFSNFPRFDLFGFFPAGDYSKLINVL